nr:hypothetical protein B0A51_06740 [Rachicladosporium sp. CCFEE 5018]
MSLDMPSRSLQTSSPAGGDRPSHDSMHPMLRHRAARSAEPKGNQEEGRESHIPRLDFEPSQYQQAQETPPLHPARATMMRYGPSRNDWDYDDRDDRRYYGPRQSYDYPRQGGRTTPGDYWEDPAYNKPHRRRPSVVHNSTPSRMDSRSGRPQPSNSARKTQQFEGSSGSESEAPQPVRRRRRRAGTADSDPGSPVPPEVIMRLPFTNWMNSNLKNHFVAAVGEFVGTTMFLFFAFAGTQVANIGANDSSASSTTGAATGFSPIVLTYISLSFGFSLMVNVWIFFRISGGLFNPAVTLAMVMVQSLSYTRGMLLLGAQLSGSMFASIIVKVLFPTTFNVRTTLSADTSIARGIFIEAILTAELVFAIFMLAKEKHRATFIAPIGIGLALFIAELVGVFYTGGSLNPARSFGPCVITGIWDKEHWIYWLGPAIGAVVAVGFYKFIKILEYEMANPGQDEVSEEKAERRAEEVRAEKGRETV